jgi:ubiquitin fusion degradation protein 1
VDFIEISNPRAVLEVTLRKFTCLTQGDMICINHAGYKYYLEVKEVQPNGAASIIETDCSVDFVSNTITVLCLSVDTFTDVI